MTKYRIMFSFSGRRHIETVEQETLDFLRCYPNEFNIKVLEEDV